MTPRTLRPRQRPRSFGAPWYALASALLLAGAHTHAATPDISGPWQITGNAHSLLSDAAAALLLPGAREVYEKNLAARKSGDSSFDPLTKCLPPGVPRLMMQPYPFNIVQGSTMYGFIFEWNHLNRVVYMNQAHFDPIGPLYLGQSIGHWEGDTLIIDTNSYNNTTLLDDSGLPHSDELHTLERLRLKHGGQELEDRIQFEDPKTFSRAWQAVLSFSKRPSAAISEDYCLGRTGHGTLQQK